MRILWHVDLFKGGMKRAEGLVKWGGGPFMEGALGAPQLSAEVQSDSTGRGLSNCQATGALQEKASSRRGVCSRCPGRHWGPVPRQHGGC